MTALGTTGELPGAAFDPEPDDDDGPWCHYPDLGGQGLSVVRLHTMTTVTVSREYL